MPQTFTFFEINCVPHVFNDMISDMDSPGSNQSPGPVPTETRGALDSVMYVSSMLLVAAVLSFFKKKTIYIFDYLESSEEKPSPQAERPQQDDAVEKSPDERPSPRASLEERPSPRATPAAGPASDRSESSGSDDDDSSGSSNDDDEHVGALRKIRSSVAQIRVR